MASAGGVWSGLCSLNFNPVDILLYNTCITNWVSWKCSYCLPTNGECPVNKQFHSTNQRETTSGTKQNFAERMLTIHNSFRRQFFDTSLAKIRLVKMVWTCASIVSPAEYVKKKIVQYTRQTASHFTIEMERLERRLLEPYYRLATRRQNGAKV